MKKFLFLTLIFCAAISTNIYAQAGDPPSLLDQMKEKLSPQMVEKTGLTRAQADKVIEINYDMRQALSVALKDLNETDRAAKIAEFKAGRDKKYSEIPLTEEQITAVKSFYENMGKDMPPKGGN
jgi:Spy/CpxP family protein refolding chaperone